MYERLIENYIHSLREEDIKAYAIKEGVAITDHEVHIIYEFIMKNYKALLSDTGMETTKKYIATKNKFF